MPASFTAPTHMEEVRLHLLNVGAKINLSRSILGSLEFRHYEDRAADELIYQIHAYVQAEHLGTDIHKHTEQFPATWWQHWKQDHQGNRFTRWISRRWPVKTKDVTLVVETEHYKAFTDSDLVVDPKLGQARYWRFTRPEVVSWKDQ